MKALDLFCGRGGWTKAFLAEGFEVVGIDNEPQPDYPAEATFLQADVCGLGGAEFRDCDVVVASPPCQGFSKASALVRRGQRPVPQDCRLVIEGLRVIGEAEPRFWAVENVQGALGWFRPILGEPTLRNWPWYIWGRFPAFVTMGTRFPKQSHTGYWTKDRRTKERRGKHSAAMAAEIPAGLAGPFAAACRQALEEPPQLTVEVED